MERVQLAFIGVWELLVILAIVVVIFGAGKLPQLGEALGKTIRNFRKSYKEDPKEIDGEARRLPDTPEPERLPPARAQAKVPDAARAESKPTVDRP